MGGGVLIAGGGVGCTDCFQNDAEPVCRGLAVPDTSGHKKPLLEFSSSGFLISVTTQHS